MIQQIIDAGLPVIPEKSDEAKGRYAFSDSLTDGQTVILEDILHPPTETELAARLREEVSRDNAKAIPYWVSWSEVEALTWLAENIGAPLDTPIPETITLTNIRPTLIGIVNVMKKQYEVEQAQTRMLIAIRDKTWPDLQDK